MRGKDVPKEERTQVNKKDMEVDRVVGRCRKVEKEGKDRGK